MLRRMSYSLSCTWRPRRRALGAAPGRASADNTRTRVSRTRTAGRTTRMDGSSGRKSRLRWVRFHQRRFTLNNPEHEHRATGPALADRYRPGQAGKVRQASECGLNLFWFEPLGPPERFEQQPGVIIAHRGKHVRSLLELIVIPGHEVLDRCGRRIEPERRGQVNGGQLGMIV